MGQTLSEPVVEKVCSFLFYFFANLIFLSFFFSVWVSLHIAIGLMQFCTRYPQNLLLGRHHSCI